MIHNLMNAINTIDFKAIQMPIIIIIFISILLFCHNKRKDNIEIIAGEKLFENLKNPIIITDSEKKIIYVNKSFEELTGFTMKEVLNKHPNFLNAGIQDKDFSLEMKENLMKGVVWEGEVWNRKKNGEIFSRYLTITEAERHRGKSVNYLGIYQDVVDIKAKEDQFRRLDKYDLLTGLPNEKYLEGILAKEIDLERTKDEKQFLLSIRITNYDEVVASYGYRLMDEVIVNMSKRIGLVFNGIGILFRTGKENFIILGSICKGIHNIESIIEDLNNAIDIGFSSDSEIIFINIAMGILPITNKHNNISKIIEDINLSTNLAEKSNDKNYVFYSEGIREKLQREVKIEALLRAAIDNKELSLLYQPQIDSKTNEIIGAEALVRWDNGELGQVLPFIFIPIAEKIGVINDIGKWVITEACKQNKNWQEKGLPKIPISVNLSPIQFKNESFIHEVKEILNNCELEGKYLGIEITESTLAENINDVNKKLSLLKNMGIPISIDDFGTGYSSLGYLRKLKFDYIKIDREFIKDYPEKDNGAIAKVILNLSRELKINSVAEGVETKEQLNFITTNGGNIIQGYYYSPPVSAEKIEELLAKKNESA